jgi:MFS family permease
MNLVFLTVLLGMLLSALDQTVVSTALPTIVGDLGGAGHLSWVVSSYLLADTVATVRYAAVRPEIPAPTTATDRTPFRCSYAFP